MGSARGRTSSGAERPGAGAATARPAPGSAQDGRAAITTASRERPEVVRAMRRALVLACSPDAPTGRNPRVGCVLVDGEGRVVAEGYHRGAGTPHAEAVALAAAGSGAAGTTAVVTLEPCSHTGRTAPCAAALVRAGVARVVFAQTDPNPRAAGGAQVLRSAGVQVDEGLLGEQARRVNPAWSFAMEHRRPFVTWKVAATLDGRVAASDGTSRWISSPAARRDTHRLRARADAVVVGTGTVAADDPELTVREEDDVALPVERQPLRVVVGTRALPRDRRVLNDRAHTLVLATRDPREALAALFEEERWRVLVEGGPTLAAAFLRAGLVDEVVAYVAPVLLGSGAHVVGDLGVTTLAEGWRLRLDELVTLGAGDEANARLTLVPTAEGC